MRRRAGEWTIAPQLMFRATPAGALVLAGVTLAAGLLPAAAMIAVGALVGAATELPNVDDPLAHIAVPFALLCAAWLGEQLSVPARTIAAGHVARRVAATVSDTVLRASLRPTGIEHLQDDRTIDRLARAVGGAGNHPPESAVGAATSIAITRITGIAAAILLATILWWAPLVLIAIWIVCGRWVARQFQLIIAGFELKTSELRRANYFRNLGLDAPAAKEVMVFGMGRWIGLQFTRHWLAGMAALFRHEPGTRRAAAGRVLLLGAGYLIVLLALARSVATGAVDLAGFLVAVQATLALSAFGWAGEAQWTFASATASAREAAGLDPGPAPPLTTTTTARPARPPAIHLDAVSFRYPGRHVDAVTDLTLDVPAGTSLALVGANGAGKSTVLKLLTGIHEAHTGRITVDGVPLAPTTLRSRLAVVLQDFVRFDVLTVRENIGLGRIEAPWDDTDLTAAAVTAGADDIITSLPASWDTVLSRQFPDGAELSGGQWQRIALARALFALRHGADLLILDEPTAQLDAHAEARLYDQFLTLTHGVTTVLVSHRFNTVRLADQIAVIDQGRLVEIGDHASLLAADGHYARMFTLQAGRFVDG